MTWSLIITVWLVAGHNQTETLAGYRFQSECAEDSFTGTVDLSREQVRAGWALDYRTYSHGAYEVDEAAAKARKAGVWRWEVVAPWEWRKAHRVRRD